MMNRLLDERLAATRGPYAATAAQVIKALNKISIQSAIQAPRDASLSALLYLLSHSAILRTGVTSFFSSWGLPRVSQTSGRTSADVARDVEVLLLF